MRIYVFLSAPLIKLLKFETLLFINGERRIMVKKIRVALVVTVVAWCFVAFVDSAIDGLLWSMKMMSPLMIFDCRVFSSEIQVNKIKDGFGLIFLTKNLLLHNEKPHTLASYWIMHDPNPFVGGSLQALDNAFFKKHYAMGHKL